MKTLILIFTFLILPSKSLASYGVRTFYTIGEPSFQVKKITGDDNRTLKYQPNTSEYYGVTLNLGFLSVSLGQQSDPDASSILAKGNSDYKEFRVELYKGGLGIEFYEQSFSGLFLLDEDLAVDKKDENAVNYRSYPKFPEMGVHTLGASLFYVWDADKFDYQAAFSQSRKIKKSGGALVLTLFFDKVKMNNDGSIFPAEYVDDYEDFSTLSSFEISTMGAMVGWGHSFLFSKSWFFSFIGSIGVGLQDQKFATLTQEFTTTESASRGQAKVSMGYNSEHFYVGGSGVTNYYDAAAKDILVTPTLTWIEIFAGVRF